MASQKVTIKVKLSDEDFEEITLDWSEATPENEHVLLIEKIASFIGLPAFQIHSLMVHKSIENITPAFPGSFSIQSLEHGDSFYLDSSLIIADTDWLFKLCIDLVSTEHNDIDPINCTGQHCHHSNTRVWLNKKKGVISNSSIFPQIRAGFAEERYQNGDQWLKSLTKFNIRQYFNPKCQVWANIFKRPQETLYLRNTG